MTNSDKANVPNHNEVINILKEVEEKLPREMLAYLVLPNVILTLSGERPIGDGVFWSPDEEGANIILEDLKKIEDSLSSYSNELHFSCSRFNNPNIPNEFGVEYTILYQPGLVNTLERTGLLQESSKAYIIDRIGNNSSEEELHQLIVTELEKDDRWDRVALGDRGAMAQGIALGYPDKAILSAIANKFNYSDRERSFMLEGSADHHYEELVDAEIKFSSYLICPEPRYSYARSLINDQEIKCHEKRWSDILRDFYTSEYFTSLGHDIKFRAKIDQVS